MLGAEVMQGCRMHSEDWREVNWDVGETRILEESLCDDLPQGTQLLLYSTGDP